MPVMTRRGWDGVTDPQNTCLQGIHHLMDIRRTLNRVTLTMTRFPPLDPPEQVVVEWRRFCRQLDMEGFV